MEQNYQTTEKFKENKKAWTSYLIGEKIWGEERVAKFIDDVFNTIPDGAEEKAIPVKKDAAIAYFDRYCQALGINPTANSGAVIDPSQTKPAGDKPATSGKTKFVLPSVPTDVLDAAKANIQQHKEDRYKTMNRTSVEKLIWERGPLSMYKNHFPETSVVVKLSKEELEEYRKDLDGSDEESVKNFKIIEEAIANQKPLALNLNSSAPQPKGAIIKTPKRGEGTEQIGTETKDVNALKGFLLGRVPLRIPSAGAIQLGVRLSEPVMKDEQETYGSTIGKRYDMRLQYTGKKEAFQNTDYAEFLSEVALDDNKKAKTQTKTMSIARAFKVKKKDETTNEYVPGKTKTIRLKAEVAVPVFARKNDDIVKYFPSKGNAGVISALESGPDKIANDMAYEKTLLTAISGLSTDPALLGDDFAEILTTVKKAKSNAASRVAGGFSEE